MLHECCPGEGREASHRHVGAGEVLQLHRGGLLVHEATVLVHETRHVGEHRIRVGGHGARTHPVDQLRECAIQAEALEP